jgi:hypothetical protein
MTAGAQRDTTSCAAAAVEADRPLRIGAGIFVLAAVVVAIAQTMAPMDRGWWLVAFFGLVGGLSQWLLGAGLVVVARDAGARAHRGAGAPMTTVLWNGGTVLVAAADLAEVDAVLLLGSAALVGALLLFGRGLREVIAAGHVTALSVGYAALLVFLTVSVLVGAGLAGALPGQ